MINYKIIEGVIKGRTKKKIFIKIDRDGEIEYRGVNVRERKWGVKYGPYHTIRQKAGSLKSYDCGRISYQVDEICTIYDDVDGNQVALGYRNIDIHYEE